MLWKGHLGKLNDGHKTPKQDPFHKDRDIQLLKEEVDTYLSSRQDYQGIIHRSAGRNHLMPQTGINLQKLSRWGVAGDSQLFQLGRDKIMSKKESTYSL